ncbi:hypothetical protein FSPOR_11238 [Fusarium sporotrichioides]|uniref:Uncharacterized protein n=1 Tax=Fusarium sporotrichioides TaxID=5514 RepID=A0A395RHI3_FUSSP|nr:hypothetical protein FSPOR_11238 [Fusarium sporotrichioides]
MPIITKTLTPSYTRVIDNTLTTTTLTPKTRRTRKMVDFILRKRQFARFIEEYATQENDHGFYDQDLEWIEKYCPAGGTKEGEVKYEDSWVKNQRNLRSARALMNGLLILQSRHRSLNLSNKVILHLDLRKQIYDRLSFSTMRLIRDLHPNNLSNLSLTAIPTLILILPSLRVNRSSTLLQLLKHSRHVSFYRHRHSNLGLHLTLLNHSRIVLVKKRLRSIWEMRKATEWRIYNKILRRTEEIRLPEARHENKS